MSRGNDITMVLVLNRISALSGFFFWNALRYQFMDKCLLPCEVSQKSIRRVSRYLGISINMIKVCKLCMHWRLDLMQTNLLLLDVSEKVLSLFVLQMTLIHSRSRWTQVHLRDFETHENVWIRVKRNAVSFSNFLTLLSRKQLLKQNSSID